MTAPAFANDTDLTSTGTVRVQIKMLGHADGLDMPHYATEHAAGMDAVAAVPVDAPITLAPGAYAVVPTGVSVALPVGYELQVRARSGLAAKHGISLVNGIGTIDADYRGEIGVIMINHGPAPFVIERGMRIAQFVVTTYSQVSWEAVSELPTSARGAGGFGSTGK